MKVLASVEVRLTPSEIEQLRDPTQPGLRLDLPVFQQGRIPDECTVHLDGEPPADGG